MEQSKATTNVREFDLSGGVLCLDFANTLNWHASDHPEEELNHYADLAEWGRQAGLIPTQEAAQLTRRAAERPAEAEQWLAEAITLREAIYRVFVAISHGEQPAAGDLGILTRFWRQAVQSQVAADTGSGLKWEWEFHPDDLGRVLWPVAQSAIDLLASDQRDRAGQCQDDRGCGFLFLDTSRNRSRRWCSMEACGNRAKAQRHYSRERA